MDSDDELPQAILQAARDIELLPEKSKHRYKKEFENFTEWCESQHVKSLKEEVFLAYFVHLSKTCRPNTLWSRYSMLKHTIKIQKNVDITQYFRLTSFLKKQNIGFQTKKAKIFTKEQIHKFILEAPDKAYLIIKVATIFGLAGACRRDELAKMTTDDITEREGLLIVNIPDSKNHTSRSFVISSELNNGKYMELYKKYASLRKPGTPHNRFFVNCKQGTCTVQCVGVNSFGKYPSEIAAYLGLPNPELYTGHSFRRSSATMLADSGEGITNIKRLGGWKSTAVAEGYLEESTEIRKKMSNKILSTEKELPCTSSSGNCAMPMTPPVQEIGAASIDQTDSSKLLSAINLQNASNFTLTININNKKDGQQKLAHQSNILLQYAVINGNGTDSLMLLEEIERLKRNIEEERTAYRNELSNLQKQSEIQEKNVKMLQERLKLVEEKLQEAIIRAESPEKKSKTPLLAPPPPPPLPLQSILGNQLPVVPLRRKCSRATVENGTRTTGEHQESCPEKKSVAPGVNEDIINAIKEKKFTLRKRKKESPNDDGGKAEKETVSEIKNILGNLRSAPKKKQSLYMLLPQ